MADTGLVVVTAVLAGATFVLAAATVYLAKITQHGLDQQAQQLAEAERNAVLPFPVVEGLLFFPEDELSGQVKPSYVAHHLLDQTIRVRNLGRGPALYLRWELAELRAIGRPEMRTRFGPTSIRPLHVSEHDSRPLPHPPTTGEEALALGEIVTPGEGGQVTLWYDDTFGNHYRCIYEHQGLRWAERSRERISDRLLRARPWPVFGQRHTN